MFIRGRWISIKLNFGKFSSAAVLHMLFGVSLFLADRSRPSNRGTTRACTNSWNVFNTLCPISNILEIITKSGNNIRHTYTAPRSLYNAKPKRKPCFVLNITERFLWMHVFKLARFLCSRCIDMWPVTQRHHCLPTSLTYWHIHKFWRKCFRCFPSNW